MQRGTVSLHSMVGLFMTETTKSLVANSKINITLNACPAKGELDMKILSSVLGYLVRAIVHLRGQ